MQLILTLVNGGEISTTSLSKGKGGTLMVTAESILLDSRDSPFFTGISAITIFGKGGDLIVSTDDLQVINGGQINATTLGPGDGGTVSISAESILVDNQDSRLGTGISAQTVLEVDGGKGGDIVISTTDLQVVNGGQISVTTFGSGDGGTLFISVDTGDLQVVNGGQISATTFGSGDGGRLAINAESILINRQNSQIATGISGNSLLKSGGGKGGDIFVDTTRLQVINGGEISANTFGSGDGGTLKITAESIFVNDQNSLFTTGISAQTLLTNGGGKGGDISIDTTELQLVNGGQIDTATFGSRDGGDIDLQVNSLIIESSAAITTEAVNSSQGQAGDITLEAGEFIELNNGSINTKAVQNDGGEIRITVGENIILSESQITAEAGSNGGNITINADKLIHLMDSEIAGQAVHAGGNITMSSDTLILDDSRIIATSILGNDWNILINANRFFISPDSLIDATVSGRTTDNPFIGLFGSLSVSPQDFLDVDAWSVASCATRFERGEIGSFVVIEREGVSLQPDDLLPSFSVLLSAGESSVDNLMMNNHDADNVLDAGLLLGCPCERSVQQQYFNPP